MKNFMLIFFLLLIVKPVSAQVQIVDAPKPGYEERIRSFVNEIRIIDTHEHLMLEEQRLQMADKIDFTTLFSHYAKEDLISASNNKGLVELIYNTKYPVTDRWELLEPIYKATRTTGFGRIALIAARDIYGISDINKSTVEQLSDSMRSANKPGLYRSILKEKAKIDLSVLDMGHQKFDTAFYRHVERFSRFAMAGSASEIADVCKPYNMQPGNLAEYEEILRKAFKEGISSGMIAVKIAIAYKRILIFENVSKQKSEEVFSAIMNSKTLRPQDTKALQDYMFHRILDLAEEFNLPVQIHTGLLAGNGNVLTNSKPTHLVNLFMEYPDVDFILFHSSYPYGGELGTLAKNFPNVFIDMCWSYAISPSYSERYLHEWMETVPANKIMAFGGDYSFVEAVYAHSVMARQVIAKVLIAKVRDRYMTEQEAKEIATMFLRENAIQILNLYGKKSMFDDVEALKRPGQLHDWWEINKTDEGFIRNWKVIGIFDYGSGLNNVYPPEKEIDFDKSYTGKNGQVNWKTESTSPAGYLNLISIFSKGDAGVNPRSEGIAYAYTEIISPDNRELKLTIGSNDGAKIWINNKVVYNIHAARNAVPDQEILTVNLKKGTNTILVKIENVGASWGLYLRAIAQDDKLKFIDFKNDNYE